MKTRKTFLLAAALVLLVGMGAMSQGKLDSIDSAPMPPEPFQDIVRLNAIEVSDGTLGINSGTKQETAFGYSFLGRTTGFLPGSFTLSMNCTPYTPIPGEASEMTGGSWTLPVYMADTKDGYAGSLYGTIASGTMKWDKSGTNANIYFVLNIDGGTHSWAGVGGYASFVGTLVTDEKTQQKTISGDLVFNIISGIK